MVSRRTLSISPPLAAPLMLVALLSATAAPSANAGVLERTKAAVGYLKNLVGDGTDLVREGMLRDIRPGDYDRRADAFYGEQSRKGLKTFVEISADGQAGIAARWKGLKGKLTDTVLSKMASAVKDKLWEVFPPGAESTGSHKAGQRNRRGVGTGWRVRRPTQEDPWGSGATAETAAGSEAARNDELRSHGTSEGRNDETTNPVLALDIDADELPWYRGETGILDEAPLPRVRISRAIGDLPPVAGRRPGEPAAGRAGVARRDCADIWDDCRDDRYISDGLPAGGERPDRWGRTDGIDLGHAALRREDGTDHAAHGHDEAADETQRNYARALASISGERSPDSPTRTESAIHRDYRSALDDLKAQARENARIETERAAAREAQRRAAIRAREAKASASASAPRPSGSPAKRSTGNRPSQRTTATRKLTGACATGPICKKFAKRGEALVQRVRRVVDRKRLDITGSSLALAFIARATMACVRVCIEREETRAHCRSGLRNAIGELKKTYKSAIGNARSASGNQSYVNQFDASPQNSPFVRRHFGDIRGNIDNCELQ